MMTDFFTFFDRIQVVSLPERTDRRREIRRSMKKAGVRRRLGDSDFFAAIRPTDAGGFPSIGARGCFLSHLEILRRARDDGVGRLLVLEDDLDVDPRLVAEQGRILERLRRDDWSFAYFGHILRLEEGPQVRLEPHRGSIMQTHFYAVRGAVLDRLVPALEDILDRPPGHPEGGPMHVDGAFSRYRRDIPDDLTLVAVPSLGWQRSSRSDVASPRWFDRPGFARGIAGLARRIKNAFSS